MTTTHPGIFGGRALFKQKRVSVEELSAASRHVEIWCSYSKHLPEKWSFEGKYASFKNIKFPRDNYKTDSSETQTHSIVFIVHC